jgi:hypothetical protein
LAAEAGGVAYNPFRPFHTRAVGIPAALSNAAAGFLPSLTAEKLFKRRRGIVPLAGPKTGGGSGSDFGPAGGPHRSSR